MFQDYALVNIQAGRGGDGRVSFHRTRFNPKGGPDGGDGGRGGNIIVRASHNSSTLSDYRNNKLWAAENGTDGGPNQRSGKNGEDRVILVPPGTIIKRGDAIVADLVEDGEEAIIARGGSGGRGNTHFKTSTFQAPKFAELGLPGDAGEFVFELKLIADVGLVGLPNAGKSTLLSVISNARPKIANYPFTTLSPNLGVARFHDTEVVVADIPGLIEGASEGKGLGDQFLRHVERTKVLVHLVDVTDDVTDSYRVIRQELEVYSPRLAAKPSLIVLSKSSFVLPEELRAKQKTLAKVAKVKMADILLLSAQEHIGLEALTTQMIELVRNAHEEVEAEGDIEIEDVSVESVVDWYLEPLGEDRFALKGQLIDRWSGRTNFQQDQAVERLRRAMSRAGVFRRLKQLDAREGHTTIEVGNETMQW